MMDSFTKRVSNVFRPEQRAHAFISTHKRITEKFKTEEPVAQNKNFRQDIGTEHPTDFKVLRSVYETVPLIFGAINKTVDFTVGPGFNVQASDERTKELLMNFLRDNNFELIMRDVAKNVLIYGCAFLELEKGERSGSIRSVKILNPEYMYVRMDKQGVIVGYTQYLGGALNKANLLNIDDVAFFMSNKVGDTVYGTSIIQPLLNNLKYKMNIEEDTARIFNRKAGAPLHIQVGGDGNEATQADLDTVRSSLEDLKNDNEFVTNHLTKINVVGFEGKTLDSTNVLSHYENQLIYGLEVPIVLLGLGNVPEGLAQVQMDAFMKRIVSLQQALEKVLENDILKRYLLSQGMGDNDFELVWEEEAPEDEKAKIELLLRLAQMSSVGQLSFSLGKQAEQELARLLSFEPPSPEEERAKEEEQSQPQVPGQNRPKETVFFCCDESLKDEEMSVKEWVDFDYEDYLSDIKEFIRSKEFQSEREFKSFRFLPGTEQKAWEEIVVTYSLKEGLSKSQISKLKSVLIEGFDNGQSIRTIRENIRDFVRPQDLEVLIPALKNDQGEIIRNAYSRIVPARMRELLLARTETIRAANEGSLNNFSGKGVEQVSWVSSRGERTCPYCDNNNGKVLNITEARNNIPAHVNCRCSWIPITE